MQSNLLQEALQSRQQRGQSTINLSFADFTCYDSLLSRKKIQHSFINIFKYPYYYPTAQGEHEALQSVCQYYKKIGQTVEPQQLLLTSSINQGYLYLLKIFTADGGEVIVPNPHLHSLDEVADFLNIKLKRVALNSESWQVDTARLEKSINENSRAIFLMSPHLPTGAIQKEETLRELLKIIAGKNITLVVDESLSGFIFNGEKMPFLSQIADPEQLVVTMQTLSNTFALPGFKISWLKITGPQEKADHLLKTIEYIADTFLTLNQLSQTVLPEVIKYSGNWRKKFKKTVERNRDIMIGKLSKSPRLRFHYPEGGFYALVEVLPPPENTKESEKIAPSFPDDQHFCLELLEKTGIYVHPGQYYHQKDGCFFMICFLQDSRVLRNALKKIVNFLKPKSKN